MLDMRSAYFYLDAISRILDHLFKHTPPMAEFGRPKITAKRYQERSKRKSCLIS